MPWWEVILLSGLNWSSRLSRSSPSSEAPGSRSIRLVRRLEGGMHSQF